MDVLFDFKELESFFEKYPMKTYLCDKFFDTSEHRINDHLIAFRHLQLTDEDIMPEYIKLMSILSNNLNIREHYYQKGYYVNLPEQIIERNIEELKYIVNYRGFWNIEKLLDYFDFNKEIIFKDLKQLTSMIPIKLEKEKQLKEREIENFIQRYYEKKRTLTNEKLNHIFKNKIEKKMTEKILNKDYLDLTGIKYPILLLLFKSNKLTYLSIVDKSLDQRMSNYKKNKEFDGYSYIHFEEEVIQDIYAEAIIRYNPKDVTFSAIDMSNSIYRSLNQIKQRYKGVKDIDLWVIKKIIKLYEIPTYRLNGGQVVLDKDLFDKAIRKYYEVGIR